MASMALSTASVWIPLYFLNFPTISGLISFIKTLPTASLKRNSSRGLKSIDGRTIVIFGIAHYITRFSICPLVRK